jgi:membrane protein YdbS with pleckstrin-like domain
MEQDFANDTIDTFSLPKFEEVQLTPIHKDYWKVLLYNILISYGVVAAGAAVMIYFIDEFHPFAVHAAILFVVLTAITILVNWISYKNKGYAFRAHDVIYRSGAIAITTTIIPYNRIQHAALHEGWLARRFGLAAIGVFTAGAQGSDIKIPGIEKEHAENIKQLLMGKVVTEESHE